MTTLNRVLRGLIKAAPHGAKAALIDSVIRNIPPVPSQPQKRRVDDLLNNLPVIAIRAQGGLGDHIVTARFIRDLFAVVGPFEFDLYTSRLEASEWLYAAFPQIRRMYSDHLMWHDYYREYPIALDVIQYVHVPHADWLLAMERNPKLARVIENVDKYRWRIQPCIDHHPNLDAHLGRIAVFHNRSRRDYLQYIAKVKYGGDAYELPSSFEALARHGIEPKKYVTVHNGFEVDSDFARVSSTKVYPHFDAIVAKIKCEFPELKIVQVGSSTSRPIRGVDYNLISRTTMPEVAGLLKHSVFHVDNESGLVHIARCYETPGCVIFGPTDVDYFGYPDNVNIRPEFCGNCWWHARDWMSTCVRGFLEPRCLTTQAPDDIFQAFAPALRAATLSSTSALQASSQ